MKTEILLSRFASGGSEMHNVPVLPVRLHTLRLSSCSSHFHIFDSTDSKVLECIAIEEAPRREVTHDKSQATRHASQSDHTPHTSDVTHTCSYGTTSRFVYACTTHSSRSVVKVVTRLDSREDRKVSLERQETPAVDDDLVSTTTRAGGTGTDERIVLDAISDSK